MYYERLLKKILKKLIPLHCLFELTYNCNLSCRHCYIIKKRKRELEKKEIFGILRKLKYAKCLYLTFSGGEILCRKDFFEIAEYSRRLGFATRLFTNGTLINEKIADKIKSLMPLSVEISLYGFQRVHDYITHVSGSFHKTVEAIRLLRNKGIKVLVKSVLMKQNVHEIWGMQKFVKEELDAEWRGLGAACLISPRDDGYRRPLDYRLDDGALRAYIEEEQRIIGRFKLKKIKGKELLCGAGIIACNITPYGELNPCVQVRLRNNNLRDNSFTEIWKRHDEIKKIRRLRMADKKDCIGCRFISYCSTCPGIALLECGSLTAKLPEACRQAKIRKEIYEKVLYKDAGMQG